ncbi:MAG: hypothetical protein WEC79_03120, partial [Thermomicrobiales bacterium]
TMELELETDLRISSFGEDEAGELYVVDLSGAIYRVTASEQPLPVIDDPAVQRTWERTDKPVADLIADRTWMWGPNPITPAIPEIYAESPDDTRVVQYFDKARMEIMDPTADESSLWYVTNGLLVVEMMNGQLQAGDDQFEQRAPAAVNVAGDPNDTGAPTYATFATLRDASPAADGQSLTARVDRAGNVADDPALAGLGVTAGYRVQEPGIDHQVASVFWEFMNSTATVFEDDAFVTDRLFLNAFYATGYPVTEAYWATVQVGGTPTDVLIQCFERRCLTYTPDNPAGWKVEAGNVGQHYYHWRYGEQP